MRHAAGSERGTWKAAKGEMQKAGCAALSRPTALSHPTVLSNQSSLSHSSIGLDVAIMTC